MNTDLCLCYNTDLSNFVGRDTFIIVRDIMGILAAVSSGILFIPDIILSCKTKGEKTHDFKFLALYLLGTIFWLIYGIMIYSISTIILELFLIINVAIISVIKCVYKINQRRLSRSLENNNENVLEIPNL